MTIMRVDREHSVAHRGGLGALNGSRQAVGVVATAAVDEYM